MKHLWIVLLAMVAAHGTSTALAQPQAGALYWTNRDRVQTSDLDGSNVQDLVTTGLNTAADIELDLVNGKMYWTDIGNRTVKRANLDGTGIETLVPIGVLRSPIGLELDVAHGKMYWSDRQADVIQRANLDGTGIETVVQGAPLGSVYQLDLDLDHGRIYWTAGSGKEIRRTDLQGQHVEILLRGQTFTDGIALDARHDRMYWTESSTRRLWAARLDGTHRVMLHEFDPTVRPLDMERDPVTGRLYIADNSGTRVWRTERNGSQPTAVIDLANPPPANLLAVAVFPPARPAPPAWDGSTSPWWRFWAGPWGLP